MTERRPDGLLLHPVALAALAAWLVNDHWAKAAARSPITGKLSDVAGLIVFPLIPVAALALWRRRTGGAPPGMTWALGWLLATALAMASIKLLAPAAWLYRHGLAALQYPLVVIARGELPPLRPVHLTMDATDLWTLPALLVPWWLLRGEARGQRTPARSSTRAPVSATAITPTSISGRPTASRSRPRIPPSP
jgi:hypothetical protein